MSVVGERRKQTIWKRSDDGTKGSLVGESKEGPPQRIPLTRPRSGLKHLHPTLTGGGRETREKERSRTGVEGPNEREEGRKVIPRDAKLTEQHRPVKGVEGVCHIHLQNPPIRMKIQNGAQGMDNHLRPSRYPDGELPRETSRKRPAKLANQCACKKPVNSLANSKRTNTDGLLESHKPGGPKKSHDTGTDINPTRQMGSHPEKGLEAALRISRVQHIAQVLKNHPRWTCAGQVRAALESGSKDTTIKLEHSRRLKVVNKRRQV